MQYGYSEMLGEKTNPLQKFIQKQYVKLNCRKIRPVLNSYIQWARNVWVLIKISYQQALNSGIAINVYDVNYSILRQKRSFKTQATSTDFNV